MFFGFRYVLALNTVQCVDLGMFLDLAHFEKKKKKKKTHKKKKKKKKTRISHDYNVKGITNYISEYKFLYIERKHNF